MMGRQHLTLGIATGAVLVLSALDITMTGGGISKEIGTNGAGEYFSIEAVYFGIGYEISVFAATCLGELFPDIDLETSMIGRIIKPISHLINKIFGHRGFIHSLLCAFITSFLVYFGLNFLGIRYANLIAGAFLIGFLLHLFQDMITKGGVKLFWPIPLNIHLTGIKSNSGLCWPITIILCVIIIALYMFMPEMMNSIFSGICSIF